MCSYFLPLNLRWSLQVFGGGLFGEFYRELETVRGVCKNWNIFCKLGERDFNFRRLCRELSISDRGIRPEDWPPTQVPTGHRSTAAFPEHF